MMSLRIEFCPACGERIWPPGSREANIREYDWWKHLEHCGVVVAAGIGDRGADPCVCGFDTLSTSTRLSEHIRVDPHDWPKLLVRREMEEM